MKSNIDICPPSVSPILCFLSNILKISSREEQDGGGVGGHGVHLSPQIHQEYTFRHKSACSTPAESGQEYLASGKEYIELWKTQ